MPRGQALQDNSVAIVFFHIRSRGDTLRNLLRKLHHSVRWTRMKSVVGPLQSLGVTCHCFDPPLIFAHGQAKFIGLGCLLPCGGPRPSSLAPAKFWVSRVACGNFECLDIKSYHRSIIAYVSLGMSYFGLVSPRWFAYWKPNRPWFSKHVFCRKKIWGWDVWQHLIIAHASSYKGTRFLFMRNKKFTPFAPPVQKCIWRASAIPKSHTVILSQNSFEKVLSCEWMVGTYCSGFNMFRLPGTNVQALSCIRVAIGLSIQI